jgi:hypothetical protein
LVTTKNVPVDRDIKKKKKNAPVVNRAMNKLVDDPSLRLLQLKKKTHRTIKTNHTTTEKLCLKSWLLRLVNASLKRQTHSHRDEEVSVDKKFQLVSCPPNNLLG